MPVFRIRSDGSQMIMQPFFNVLTDFLYTLVKSGQLDMMDLARQEEPNQDKQYHSREKWSKDVLLVRLGIPLAAVRIEVHSSGDVATVNGYVTSPSYIGAGALPASIDDVNSDLAARMRAEMPAIEKKAPKEEPEIMSEMRWVVVIRSQSAKPMKWEGGPFDIPKVEEAFDALVTMLVAATKSTPAP